MKRRRLLIAAGLVLLFAVGMVMLRQREYQRESYGGKHTCDWVMVLFSSQASESVSNRDQAITALHALGPRAIPPLRRMLAERDGFYDQAVVTAARVLPVNQRRTLVRQLRPGQALAHRLAAIAALGVMGTNASVAVLELSQAMYEPIGQIRWDAARALAALGDPAIPALVLVATGTNAGARHAAVYALAEMPTNTPLGKSTLLNAMLDPDENVRTAAIYFVGHLGLDAGPTLMDKLASQDQAQQVAALQVLSGVRPSLKLITPKLLSLATNSTGNLRRQAIETMGALRIANTNAATILVAALDDPDAAIRLTAMKAVGEISWKTGAAIPRLEEFTRSGTVLERESSVLALAQYGARASNTVPAITLLLDDPELKVRTAATNALLRINQPVN